MSQKNSVRKLINLDIKKEILSKWESGKSVGDVRVVYSFQYGKIVYAFQIYMYSVWKLNKLIIYYLYTHTFDFVLYFSCLNGCVGW